MEAQTLLFDFPKFKITNKIRLIELFGGIGSQAMALRDIGADFEHYRLVEFDKYAVQSYNAIHGTNFQTTDIRNVHGADLGIVDRDKYTYLLTYSFPCTDLSVAGRMKGMSKADWESGNSTRSGLLWEVERILKELPEEQLPQVLVMENVPQVHADANRDDFESWLSFLRNRGYINHWLDLNAKDYGIPQNRDRCFCISILSPEFIDYEFPKPQPLTKVMRDYLEDSVDEKYYINSEKAQKLIEQLIEDEILPTEQNRTEQNSVLAGNSLCQELLKQKQECIWNKTRCSNDTNGERLQRNEQLRNERSSRIMLDLSYKTYGERIYKDVSPALTSRDYKEPRMVVETWK